MTDAPQIAGRLLAVPAADRERWLDAHAAACTLKLVAELKAIGDPLGLSDPQAAAEATACALLVGARCSDPLGAALADWARGNWEIYHDPPRAIGCYERALAGYRAAGDRLSAARLLTNLVFPYTECGRLAEAEAAAAEARELLALLGDGPTRYRMVLEQNAGWLRHSQGRYAEALEVYQRALDMAYALGDMPAAAEIQVNRTITLEVFGHIAEEEQALLESRALAEHHGQRLTVARIALNLGELYAAQGRPMDALRQLQGAHAAFAELENRMELASVLLAEAGLFGWLGAQREARRGYTQARALFAELGMRPQVGVALLRGAIANRRAGALREAGALLADAGALWADLGQPAWQASVAAEQAELLLARGDARGALGAATRLLAAPALSPALAAQCHRVSADALSSVAPESATEAYALAIAAARQIGDRGQLRQAIAGAGRLRWRHDAAAARELLEEALQIDEATRQTLTSQELKSGFLAARDDLLAPLVGLALGAGAPHAALEAIWRVKGGALADTLRRPGAEGENAAVAQARELLAVLRWRRALEGQAGDEPDALRERGDPAIRDAEDALLRLLRQRDTAGSSETSAPHGLDAALRALGDAILLEYAACDGELVAVRVDPGGAMRAAALGPADAVAALLDDLQLHVQHVLTLPAGRRGSPGLIGECRALLRELHDALVAPLGPLPAGARLLVAPCAALSLAPFAALHDGERYLVERHEIELTPCGALRGLAAPPGAAAGALIIAASAEGRLGGVAGEAAAVAAALPGAATLVDQPGAAAAIRERGAPPAVLHIAAHSLLREDAPLFSALQLCGELLSVEQCYDLPLRGTELVTLSGCATGAGLETGGSLLAFQSALLAAGARAVLSSLWPIDDAAAGRWMASFYERFAAGRAPAAALREAQRALLREPDQSHPALWAAFACSVR